MSSPILNPNTLDSIKSHDSLPADSYYFILAVTVAALNRSEELKMLLDDACKGKSQQEQYRIVKRIREALIKSAPVIGLPKIIVALMTLKTFTPPALLDRANAEYSMRTADFVTLSPEAVFERGQKFWEKTYQGRHKQVMAALDKVGTPDLGASARLMYSFFLSHEEILDGRESLFVSMTGMVVTDVQSTLLNHMQGAVNHGAKVEEVNAIRDIVTQICELGGMKNLKNQNPQDGWGWKNGVVKL